MLPCVRRTNCVNSAPICVRKWINCFGQLLYPCCSVMLRCSSVHLHWKNWLWWTFLAGSIVLLLRWHNYTEWGETAVVDNDKHYGACLTEGSTTFNVGCKALESVAPIKQVILSNFFFWILHHTVFRQCAVCLHHSAVFKGDWNDQK